MNETEKPKTYTIYRDGRVEAIGVEDAVAYIAGKVRPARATEGSTLWKRYEETVMNGLAAGIGCRDASGQVWNAKERSLEEQANWEDVQELFMREDDDGGWVDPLIGPTDLAIDMNFGATSVVLLPDGTWVLVRRG